MHIPAARPCFSPADRAAIGALVDDALSSGSLTLGPNTRRLEDAFAARHQAEHAVAVSSGTAALEILLRTIGVEGREVITPTNTFYATAGAVVHAGGIPRLADVDPATLALSPATVEAAVTERTAAVVLVHIGGVITPDAEAITQLCRRRGLVLIEDAAHAHGSASGGRPAGSFGVAAAFSFYPTKVITSGEGGIIVTDDAHIRDEARIYRDQGKASFLGGQHERLGYAWRMSEVHAAIGVVQLARLDEFIATRRRAAAIYDRGLETIPGITAVTPPRGCESNYYKYVALLDPGLSRDEVKRRLRDEHAVSLSGEVYAEPLHRQPIFASAAERHEFPVADDVCSRQVCLPIHSDMTDEETVYVVEALGQVLAAEGGQEPRLISKTV